MDIGITSMQMLSDLKSSEINDLYKKILSLKLIAILMRRCDIDHQNISSFHLCSIELRLLRWEEIYYIMRI